MKAGTHYAIAPWLKLGIYGDTGAGKTRFGAVSPHPFIVLTEPQGLPTIAVANPDAEVYVATDVDELTRLLAAVFTSGSPSEDADYAWQFQWEGETIRFSTLVIDSLTNVQARVKRHWTDLQSDKVNWARAQDFMDRLLERLRDAPFHVVAIALAITNVDLNNRAKTQPLFQGQTGALFGQWFAGLGYAHRAVAEDGRLEHRILWNGASGQDCKPAPGFPDISTSETFADLVAARHSATTAKLVAAGARAPASTNVKKEQKPKDKAPFSTAGATTAPAATATPAPRRQ